MGLFDDDNKREDIYYLKEIDSNYEYYLHWHFRISRFSISRPRTIFFLNARFHYDKKGRLHNIYGPAGLVWCQYTNTLKTIYARHGKKHREDGPAVRSICFNDQSYHEEYYIYDEQYDKIQYKRKIILDKFLKK